MSNAVAKTSGVANIANNLAKKLGMGEVGEELVTTLKQTAFKGDASDAQFTALMVVANHIEISDSGCWNWTGALSRGYGQLTFNGKHQTAHRFVFDRFVEPIEDGMWVLHHCDNRRCVNPRHLYQGTPLDNRADMLNRGRWSHPWASRTHCSNGHEYEAVGFRIDKNDGSRVCRECQRNYKREQRAAKKGA